MTAIALSPKSGVLAGLAVRGGLKLAEWGLRRAALRTDRDLIERRMQARALAEAALAERDALIRRSASQLY
jgi:hypothetical protein